MSSAIFKSTYDKVRLSEEFKTAAKARLTEYSVQTSVKCAERVDAEARAYKLEPSRSIPWKAVLGFGSAAAVLALAVYIGTRSQENVPIDAGSMPSSSDVAAEQDITAQDIAQATAAVVTDEVRVLDTQFCDLDFDGQEELLLLSSWGKNEAHVFEKENGVLTESAVFGMGKLNYISELGLIPRSAAGESYHYFTFSFDNGGVMSAEVLAAVYSRESGYEVEYLLSYGLLDYSDIPEPFSQEFYRKGWSKDDIAMDTDYDDITREQFVQLYEQYTGTLPQLPEIDEVLAEEEYQATVDANYPEVRRLLEHYHNNVPWEETLPFFIEGCPEVQFVWSAEQITAVSADGTETVVVDGMPIHSVYLADLNGDSVREICCAISYGSGIIDDRIVVYDPVADKQYQLSDRGYHDYYLSYNGMTPLMVHEVDYATGEATGICGELKLDGETLCFEHGEDINTVDTSDITFLMSVMTHQENGTFTLPQGEPTNVAVKYSLPSSWEYSWTTASYAYSKVFEIGVPWSVSEGIIPEAYKVDEAYGAEITVNEEKWGGEGDLYEYFIHTSTPMKYAPDGSFDVYTYVVERSGYYITLTFVSDAGITQETIDRLLGSVEIVSEDEAQLIELPDVTDEDVEQAVDLLQASGFEVTVEFQYDETVQPDRVISMQPLAEEMLEKGSTVRLFVSTGSREEDSEG